MSGIGVEAEIGLCTQRKPPLSYLCISPLSLSVFMTYSVSQGHMDRRTNGPQAYLNISSGIFSMAP